MLIFYLFGFMVIYNSLIYSKSLFLFIVVCAGIFLGGYHYSLKMFTFEKVRARNFARAWGFVQFSQVN